MSKRLPLRTNHSFYVLVLSALAVASILIALLYKVFPLLTSQVLLLCRKFFSDIRFQIPRSYYNVLFLVIGIVFGIGLLSFLLQLCRTHMLVRKLLKRRINPSHDFKQLITSLNLKSRVILVNDNNPFSFCCGIFSPFIIVSTRLAQTFTDKELEAVLLHEQSHLLSRDPAKVLIGQTVSSMFFFLPVFRELYKNIEVVNELLADQWVLNRQQKPTFLIGALKKTLISSQLDFAVVSNVSGSDYLEMRVRRLVDPGKRHKFRLSFVSVITTFLFIFSSWLLLVTPVSATYTDSLSNSTSKHGPSNSTYFLCSADQLCTKQCYTHPEISERLYFP